MLMPTPARLIVIMLFRLGMSIDDAISAYTKLAKRVFSEKKRLLQEGIFKASLLERAFWDIMELAGSGAVKGGRMLNEEGPKW